MSRKDKKEGSDTTTCLCCWTAYSDDDRQGRELTDRKPESKAPDLYLGDEDEGVDAVTEMRTRGRARAARRRRLLPDRLLNPPGAPVFIDPSPACGSPAFFPVV